MRVRISKDWGQRRAVVYAVILVVIPSAVAFFVAQVYADEDLRKTLYTGAVTLLFGGLLGGMLKLLLDDYTAAKRRRDDAATFVSNVLADLKSVYDRVGRARLLIPAHRSVKTYGDEMRDLIEARVQLRNVARALEGRAEGVAETVRSELLGHVEQMESYLEELAVEFRDNYKALSDQQRGYEERAKVLLKRFSEDDAEPSPPLMPGFIWDSIARLPELSDFIQAGPAYKTQFSAPLNQASARLREELARILGGRPVRGEHARKTETRAAPDQGTPAGQPNI